MLGMIRAAIMFLPALVMALVSAIFVFKSKKNVGNQN
jgi:hypothetical protein